MSADLINLPGVHLADDSDPATRADSEALASALRRRIKGEVRFDDGSRALYATDASNYRQTPIGVVVPRDAEDVVATLATARKYGAPVLGRGGGTSLCGQCCNVAIVLDFSKYMRGILELDPVGKRARVEPGCVLDFLRGAAEQHHLTFGPDPSTHNHCTFGGMIGNNSCGVHSVMAGKTDDNVEELEILLYDGLRMRVGKYNDQELETLTRSNGRKGQLFAELRSFRDKYAVLIREKFPHIPRRVSGYNLGWLLPENGFDVAKTLVGSEGTLAMILEATVRLVPSPPARSLLVLGYPDIYCAGDHVPLVLEAKPIGLEGIDDHLVDDMRAMNIHPETLGLLPGGAGWLLVEFGGETKAEANNQAHALMERLQANNDAPKMKLYEEFEDEKKIWTVRRSGLGATAHVPGKNITWEGWEDASVPPEKVGPYLRDFRKLLDKFQYHGDLYGHFGQGCIHTRIDFDLETAAGIDAYRRFLDEAAELVVSFGGSISGEHGDGQSKAALLPKMFGPEMIRAFEEFKTIWDPAWKMNPGKVVRPYEPVENLRLGVHYDPQPVQTHFRFPADRDNFGRLTLRCVGVGECRRAEGGTMCPSYRVTHEEMHSTRGRAHLLFEMLQGDPLTDGWKSEPVRDALDLCLACKGCKSDCPVNVDMATYKAEFLSHYYQGRLRPRRAYAMGWIYWWARLASLAPAVANFVTQTPGLRAAAKWLAGVAQERQMPVFAPQTFQRWFAGRKVRHVDKPQVILWADTFNNHFHPEVACAAVEVLEQAGMQVRLPEASLCCGRPLYDFGMLGTAKKLLQQILVELKPWIEAGVPVVGLEPSCVAVFRDELVNLFPDNENALRLSKQTFLLSEFLNRKIENYQPPRLAQKAIVHGHCHHKAVMKMSDEEALLKKMGLDCRFLDSGCCGMAGSFGFERDHYEVSQAIGELVLLPAVREAKPEELIIANGFSCREQIRQGTDRRALHLAEVIQLAQRKVSAWPANERPEDLVDGPGHHPVTPAPAKRLLRAAIVVGVGALLGHIAWRNFHPRRRHEN
jgi:FAD/FMN-containing dehydrogenase/Fe-S oxidoreductase